MENPEFDNEGHRIIETPVINLTSSIGKIALTWINSRVRTFQDPQFDHVEFHDSNGELRAFVPTQEVKDAMFENDYPSAFDPIVDDATYNWFFKSLTHDLDELPITE